ncbi:MAG: ROK family protein, partial [Actinomycetota bacterium]|nr:ROK family protein [Actinomycetota bacterium]
DPADPDLLACHVTDDAAVEAAVAGALERLGGLDVLINNAGIGIPQSAGAPPDADALAVLDELGRWIAIGLANLVNLMDPALIVIGGGVGDAADLVLPAIRAQSAAEVLGHGRRPDVPIVAAELGERAGAIGMALLAAN